MKLTLPIWYGEKIITDYEIISPSGGIIADTQKTASDGNYFLALFCFVSGCIIEFRTEKEIINNVNDIKSICRNMKFKALDTASLEIMKKFYDDDGVEGIYECPMCHKQNIAIRKDGIDTRDFISELETVYYDGTKDYFEIVLDNIAELKDKKNEVLFEISTLGLRYPSITDYIEASAKFGNRDAIRLQYEVYVKCLERFNGETIDNNIKHSFGMLLFEKAMATKDINKIAREINKYGIQTKIKKVCNNCGKEWMENLNTASFFASALQ
jgi:hypothetical protein